ncbi:MAG: tetratricopeptide repeat protein [Paracoccaceae bacterium]|uniref:tetratricopeptide repeat protein n=1 Tax=Shimia thalassica TaxID=1715693 RepID=UPI0032968EEB
MRAYPDTLSAVQQSLLVKLYLRSNGEDFGASYDQFKVEFEENIERIETEGAAFLWDRLGHWAQDEENWVEAERCFRRAFDLDGGHYGYCLGTALNFLGRCEESLPILRKQAEEIQPDDMSWFQVAVAAERTGKLQEAISAYNKAIELNPNYDLAWFNLGGVHWNRKDFVEASRIWKAAVEKFPDHELAHKLRQEIPMVLL